MKKIKLNNHKRVNIIFASMYAILLIGFATIFYKTYSEFVTETHIWDGNETGTSFAGGDGTEAHPYLIATPAELAYFRNRVDAGSTYAGSYFQVTNDIDLNGKTWNPIGSSTASFRGTFDGAGHTISNALISTDSSLPTSGFSAWGFFASLGGGTTYATIKNVVFDNISVDVNYNGNTSTNTGSTKGVHIGTVVGAMYKSSNISNVIVKNSSIDQNGSISFRSYAFQYYVGGLVGYAVNSTNNNADPGEGSRYIIDNCAVDTDIYSSNRLSNSSRYYYSYQVAFGGVIGGIRGQAVYPTNSLYQGSITASYGFIGPIFGAVRGANNNPTNSNTSSNFTTVYNGNDAGTVSSITSYYNSYQVNNRSYSSTSTASSSLPGLVQGVNKGNYLPTTSNMLATFNDNSSDIVWTYDETDGFGMISRLTGNVNEEPRSSFNFNINDYYQTGTYSTTWYVNGVETPVTDNSLIMLPSFTLDRKVKVIASDGTYYTISEFTIPKVELYINFTYDAANNRLTASYAGSATNYYDMNDFSETWTYEDISGYTDQVIATDTMTIDTTGYETGADFHLSSTNGEFTVEGDYSIGSKTVVYVDYYNGSNYNSCLSPDDPCETMQYAYQKLSSTGTVNSNIVVVMGDYNSNSYFNSANNSTYAKKATITSVYKKTDYNGVLYFEGYNNGYKYLNEDTSFQYIELTGSTGWSTSQCYFYLQGYNLVMGEGVTMTNYSTSNTNQGLITGNAPAFHVFGGWLQYNQTRLPRNNQTVLIKSGTYGRIILGGSNGTASETNMRQSTSHNFMGSNLTDDTWKSNLIIDIKNSTRPSNYTYDVNLVVGGSAWGNMYADVTENIKNGKIGRVLGASIGDSSIALSNWNYPLNTYIGQSTINISGGTVQELYGGALGRNMNALSGSSSVICDSYFYGKVNVNISGGTVNGNIYGAGAGGVSGYSTQSTDKYKSYGLNVPTEVDIRVTGGTVNGNIYGGGYGYTEYLTQNVIATDGGTLYGNSKIFIDGGTINGNIYGAGRGYINYSNRTSLAQMYGNSEISLSGDATISGNIYGAGEGASGYVNNAKMTGNPIVNVAQNISSNVFGGGNIAPLFGNPTVNISSGTVTGTIYGGGNIGDVTGNSKILVTGGDSGDIFGGGLSADISNTVVEVQDGKVTNLFGGANADGIITSTLIKTTGGEMDYVYGGNNEGGSVQSTKLEIAGGTFNNAIFGGGNEIATVSTELLLTGSTNSVPAIYAGGNSAAVTSSTLTNISGITAENIFGGSNSSGNVASSTININSGTVTDVYGGNDKGDTTTVTYIYSNGGTATNVFGGGRSTSVPTTNLFLQGGTIGDLYGGSDTTGNVATSNVTTTSGTVTNIYGGNNKGGVTTSTNVTINGGSIAGSVYGGGNETTTGTTNVTLLSNTTVVPFIFGGGKSASVTTTNVNLNGGSANYAFGGSNTDGTITDSNITMNGGVVNEVYGGNNQGGTAVTTDVEIIGGSNQYVYGGNNEGGSTTNSVVNITGGNVFNAYGGGNAAITGNVSLTVTGATIGNVLYGGGNLAGVTSNTAVNIVNSSVNGNIFGGGNSGSVGTNTNVYFSNSNCLGSVHAGGNGASAVVYGNTLLNIDKASNISGSVFGGGNAAAVGTEDTDNSTSTVNIVGGHIGGSVYGGGNTAKIFGNTYVNIGYFAINNSYLGVSNLTIDGTVFGGGEANKSGDSSFDWTFDSVSNNTYIVIDGRDYSTFNILGSIFGSGDATKIKKYSYVTIRNYGTFNDYKTNVSLQRTNYVTIDKSAILFKGAKDRNLEEYKDNLFSINRVDRVELINNSTLFLENGTNMLSSFVSSAMVNNAKEIGAVTIREDGTVSKNVDNRLYALEGVNINIASDEYNEQHGQVSGMTFFGLFNFNSLGKVSTALYKPTYQSNSPVTNSDNLYFTAGSYVEGKHLVNHDIKVNGFYSNFVLENSNAVTQKYIDPKPDNASYYKWSIGEQVSRFTVTLEASKYSTLGTQVLKLDSLGLDSPNTVFSVIGFNYGDLVDGINLVPQADIPRIASSEANANSNYGLTVKTSPTGWMNDGATEFYTDEDNPFSGTIDYYHENVQNVSDLVFYLYHSKNITGDAELGQVVVSFQAEIPDPDNALSSTIKRINVIVKLKKKVIPNDEYEGTLAPGKKYELFAASPVNVTSKSTFSAYFSLFATNAQNLYKTGYHRAMVSTYVLPENTKITMIDYSKTNEPEYYYYIVTAADVVAATTEYNTYGNGEASYNISKFTKMGSTDTTNNYSDSAGNAAYYDADTSYASEEFIFMFDFSESNITSDATGRITFELRDSDDETIVNVMNGSMGYLSYNLNYNKDAYIDLSAALSKNKIYGGETTNLSVLTNFVKTNNIIDTAFYDQKLGLKISLYDSNNNLLNGTSVMGVSYTYNGITYYPNLDGSARINISDRVVNVLSNIEVKLNKNTLATGAYKIRIESFGSPDGIYYGLTPSDMTEVTLNVVDSLYGLKVNTPENNIILDHTTGFNLGENNTSLYTIDYSSGLTNPNVTVVLERRKYDEVGSLDYENVDLKDYVTDTLTATSFEKEYLVTNNPTALISQYFHFKENLPTGTYKVTFKLYDGTVFVGKAFKYLIIK